MCARRLGIILLLGSCFPVVLAASDRPLIQTLLIRGTRRPVEMETRAGQPLDETRIERDVRRLWATGWFDDIRVESSEIAEGVQLTFTLVERPRLGLRRIEFKPARERVALNLQKREAVDPVLAKRVAAELRRQLVEEGYADASVEAELKPVGLRQADLHVRVERGRVYRVREVRLAGSPGLRPKELEHALHSTRPRRLLPGLGPLWHGWRHQQPFSEQRLQADVERLRSLYFSRGYFDARVEIGVLKMKDGKATVTLDVDSGRHYGLRHVGVVGIAPAKEIRPQPGRAFSTRELCQCLLEARRASEKRGELDFSAQLELREAPAPAWAAPQMTSANEKYSDQRAVASPWVDLTARIITGPVYRVGRIEFSGHRGISDVTLRRTLLLKEGDLFDQECLRRSLARLSRLGFLEPVTPSDVRTELVADDHRANLKIRVKENRGQWSVWGTPPQFAIKARLLPPGRGPAELSTYSASFSLLALPLPWVGLLTSAPRARWQAFGALERPHLPGRSWQSGFVVSPQLGWRETLAGYALTHALRPLETALGEDSSPRAEWSVPASWRPPEAENEAPNAAAGVLNCEERKPSWAWLRTTGSAVMYLAANSLLPTVLR